jgi:hypothetical protein
MSSNNEKPPLANIPQEVYDELELYKSCYEYLQSWHNEWISCESGGQHVALRRKQLAKDTKELLAEVKKMQEQKASAV